VLVDTSIHNITIWKTEVYGEAFATSRKGHTEATCNLDCRIYWRGRLKFNGGVVGSAEGTIKFPEVQVSVPVENWVMKILADGEDPSAMKLLNPCGSLEETKLRPLEEYERELRDQVVGRTEEIRRLMAQFIQDMMLFSAGEAVSDVCDNDKLAKVAEDKVSEGVMVEVRAKMEQIRIDGIPSKWHEILAQIEANDEKLERAELSICRVTDNEIPQLVAALKNNTNLKKLNLSFNAITDVGVQAIVTGFATGAAKGLMEMQLQNNNVGDMGKRMLDGVKFMRKHLKVTTESALAHISAVPVPPKPSNSSEGRPAPPKETPAVLDWDSTD